MKFLVFHNAADDSYMNSVENYRGAYATDTTVSVYFKAAAVGNGGDSTGYDKIVLACTNGEEDRAVEELAAAMTKNAPVITIADDVNSVYACQNITSVTSITLGSTGNFTPWVTATFTTADTGGVDNRIVVTNAMSGSNILVNSTTDADSTIYLPASPVNGARYKFVCAVAGEDDTITVTAGGASTAFYGVSLMAGDTVEHTGTTSMVIADNDWNLGDWFEVTYNSTISKWHLTGISDIAAAYAVS
jgi:hypothetical protein